MTTVEIHTPFAPEAQGDRGVTAIDHVRESRVSVLQNGKLNAEVALLTIRDALSLRYGVIKSMVAYHPVAGRTDPDLLVELKERSDLVLVGSAD